MLLVVEVAETSADADREVKVPLYARAGVPETWAVDLHREVVEVYRKSSPEGYLEVQQVRKGQSLSVEAFPDLSLSVGEILT